MRVLYHLPLSPFSRKVRLVLVEKRLPFELELEKVWERRDEFLEMNAACTVPVLVDGVDREGRPIVIADSGVICEYLEEAHPNAPPLLPKDPVERAEVRRLVAWMDGKFAQEVSANLLGEKFMKRLLGRGNPDATALRAGYANLRHHLDYIGWLAESRRWLAGDELSVADFAAAGHLSALDFAADVDWSMSEPARDWYAKIKSRPSFRPLLQDQVPGVSPPPHYADLDF